jgi:uncharacterized protein YbjT (DUF2867 family)
MKAIIFGATGMVGQGVLRECLLDPDVERVLTIGRSATGQRTEKLQEMVLKDLSDYSSIEAKLSGYDACFFCLGISSTGLSEGEYTRITHDIAVAAGQVLARINPEMTFVFVSGAGADSTERGRTMWARVKGKTENALLGLPFKGVYVVRPAFIQPMHGIQSRTKLYRVLYGLIRPLFPLVRVIAPGSVTTTEELAQVMIRIAKRGASKKVLESANFRGVL